MIPRFTGYNLSVRRKRPSYSPEVTLPESQQKIIRGRSNLRASIITKYHNRSERDVRKKQKPLQLYHVLIPKHDTSGKAVTSSMVICWCTIAATECLSTVLSACYFPRVSCVLWITDSSSFTNPFSLSPASNVNDKTGHGLFYNYRCFRVESSLWKISW